MDGTFRPRGDYQILNEVTRAELYPLPHLQDFTTGSMVFTKLDLVRESSISPDTYRQIGHTEDSCNQTVRSLLIPGNVFQPT